MRRVRFAALLAAALLLGSLAGVPQGTSKDPGASPTKSPSPTPTPSPVPDPVCDVFVPAPTGLNDTAAIEQAEAQTPDGGTLCFPESASYVSEETWVIVERTGLTVLGNGATLRATTLVGDQDPSGKFDGREHVRLQRTSGVTIRDLNVASANDGCIYQSEFEFEHAFVISGAVDTLLDRVSAYGVGGDFLYLTEYQTPPVDGVRGPRYNTDGLRVVGSSFDCNGRQGIGDGGGVLNVSIDGNTFDRIARTFIDIEQDRADHLTENFSVTNNVVGSIRNVTCCGGMRGTVRNVTFSGNVVSRLWLKVGPIVGLTMVGNVATQPIVTGGGAPWGFSGTLGVIFDDNHQPLADGTHASSALGLNGACEFTASNSSVIGATTFWPPPGPPGPEGCSWVDGGGNTT